MNRKLGPTKSPQQIKEEQVNLLLEDIKKNLQEYKTAIELRDKQIADTKRILKGAKVSYNNLLKENKQLKGYISGIIQNYQKQQEEQETLQDTQYFRRPKKIYKKVVYKKESDSEPEAEEIERKQQAPIRKIKFLNT